MSRTSFVLIMLVVSVVSSMAIVNGVPPQYQREFALGQAGFSPKTESSIQSIREIARINSAEIHKVTRVLDIWLMTWEPGIDDDAYQAAMRSGDYLTMLSIHEAGESEVLEMVEILEKSGHVEFACPNYYRYIAYTPNDPYYPDDGDHTDSSTPDQFDKALMHCPEAWDIERGSSSIRLAIIDSGTDIDHPDLSANIYINPGEDIDADNVLYDLDDLDGLDNDGNGYIDDLFGYDFCGGVTGEETSPPDQEDWNPDIHYYGDDGWGEPDPSVGNGTSSFPLLFPPDQGVSHGTHTSGIAGAVMDNAIMFAGVAGGGCKIVPVRVGNPEGSMTATDIAAGIEYAVTGAYANVISMSLGSFSSESEPMESLAIELAWGAGVTIVCASGNNSGMPFIGNDSVGYPASATKTIAIGSCDASGNRASYSQHGSMLDVVAPGGVTDAGGASIETIWSTWVVSVAEANDDPTLTAGEHIHYHAEGTSMSCPQVAGICGLLLSRDPTLDNEEIRTILRETATDVMTVGRDLETGNGLVNAYDALLYLGVEESDLPRKSALTVYPNPFNAECRIESPSEVDIFDVNGRLVREIPATTGNTMTWNGLDEAGRELPSGVYLARTETADGRITKAITLLR